MGRGWSLWFVKIDRFVFVGGSGRLVSESRLFEGSNECLVSGTGLGGWSPLSSRWGIVRAQDHADRGP